MAITQPKTYLKAIYATLVAFLGALGTVLVGGTTIGDIEQGQWLVAVLAALTAFGGTYGLTNRPAT